MGLEYISGSPMLQVDVAYTASQTKSSAVSLREHSLLVIEHPSTMGGKSITFESAQTEGGTYRAVYDDTGSAYTITLDTSGAHRVILDPSETVALGPYVKVVVSTAAAATLTLYAGQVLERGKGF